MGKVAEKFFLFLWWCTVAVFILGAAVYDYYLTKRK